jgi:hypothetical protein
MFREAGEHSRSQLMGFLKRNYSRMPRTALRYAVEHLPEAQRKRVLKGLFACRGQASSPVKLEDPGQMQPQELRNTLQKKLHWRSLVQVTIRPGSRTKCLVAADTSFGQRPPRREVSLYRYCTLAAILATAASLDTGPNSSGGIRCFVAAM